MAKTSAGILLYRRPAGRLEVLLVHPGGPFWRNKERGAWSIPKGEIEGEEPLAAARREFQEEIGQAVEGNFIELTPVTQKGGKVVYAFALEGDLDPDPIHSNTFEMEWPPGSGKRAEFPEIDRAEWFGVDEATEKINAAQAAFIRELTVRLGKD